MGWKCNSKSFLCKHLKLFMVQVFMETPTSCQKMFFMSTIKYLSFNRNAIVLDLRKVSLRCDKRQKLGFCLLSRHFNIWFIAFKSFLTVKFLFVFYKTFLCLRVISDVLQNLGMLIPPKQQAPNYYINHKQGLLTEGKS